MGIYDTIRVGEREGQVKCFPDCYLRDYAQGEEVPVSKMSPTYSIAMVEGGFVNIDDDRIEDWTDHPRYPLVIDKWGGGMGAEAVRRHVRGETY